ncbi:MAG: hypothetical protein ACPGO3_15705 [Magnetospiraceae bacterium]
MLKIDANNLFTFVREQLLEAVMHKNLDADSSNAIKDSDLQAASDALAVLKELKAQRDQIVFTVRY